VWTHHFASVSGYGHDDLGRQTLDQVFGGNQAEAGAGAVCFWGLTRSLCALFGVLRPGDEMLAVGFSHDTLEEVIITVKTRFSDWVWHPLPSIELTGEGTVDWGALGQAMR